jgi:hypothetical protein
VDQRGTRLQGEREARRLRNGANLPDVGLAAVASLGRQTVRWSHAESHALRLTSPRANWDTHNAIRLTLHNQVAVDGAVMLIVGSENAATEGMDYWMSRIGLDIPGRRELVFPRRTMGSARSPLGWDQITEAYLTASGWGNTPNPDAVLHIERLELVDMPEEHGPRMTDDELLGALDLNHPGQDSGMDVFRQPSFRPLSGSLPQPCGVQNAIACGAGTRPSSRARAYGVAVYSDRWRQPVAMGYLFLRSPNAIVSRPAASTGSWSSTPSSMICCIVG